ncbi:hypothetical protein H105_02854 [Trichophyton soudanense CBS 452.61]|uniref:Uncharacterized protein n=1 Tax=Trichophyton soudanense CBS 452.61 TaxID=1215331 RepID=A0A022XZE7_TRISD|nr:hypothetical protein H105_02854 [Trichophyton soudanense CBS 452.61]
MSSIMSQPQMDVRSVGSCVAAVVAAYNDAAKLVKRIQSAAPTTAPSPVATTSPDSPAIDEASNTSALSDLGDSLMLGPPIVQGQYEENLMRLGNAYANGDQNARETLKDVVINLQLTLLATLRMALLDNLELDFAALQRASDESRISALVCLFQLGQRLSLGSPSMLPKAPLATSTSPTRPAALSDPGSSSSPFAGSSSPAAATDPRKPPPIPPMSPSRVASNSISSADLGNRVSRESNYINHRPPSSINPVSPPLKPQSNYPPPKAPYGPSAGHGHGVKTPPTRLAELQGSQPMIREESNRSASVYSVLSSNNSSTKGVEAPMDRYRSNPSSGDPHIEPDQSAVELSAGIFSRTSSSRSSSNDPRKAPHPGTEKVISQLSSSPGTKSLPMFKWKPFARSTGSSSSKNNSADQPMLPPPDLYLPTEENNFAGFCKGAWRLQNSMKNSFRIDNRPVGMYMLQSSWHCSKCSFEGIVQESKFSGKAPVLSSMLGPVKTSIIQGMRVLQMFDQTVHLHGPSGNRYRWIFLAKSHVECKPPKPTDKVVCGFGCIFCSVQNHGPAPIYGNLDTFMEHLREHRGRGYAWDRKKPSQPLLDWTRCILGRIADDSEDFDINIPTVAEVGG